MLCTATLKAMQSAISECLAPAGTAGHFHTGPFTNNDNATCEVAIGPTCMVKGDSKVWSLPFLTHLVSYRAGFELRSVQPGSVSYATDQSVTTNPETGQQMDPVAGLDDSVRLTGVFGLGLIS